MVPKLNKASFGVIAVLAATVAFAGIQPTASAAGLDKKGMAEAKKATQLYKTRKLRGGRGDLPAAEHRQPGHAGLRAQPRGLLLLPAPS
jgi:hypothetical protein